MRDGSAPRPSLLDAPAAVWALGIEDTFVPHESSRTGRLLDEYILTGHDRRWRDDLRLVAELGVRWLRYGIPWYRVNPAPGRFDWSWTDEVLPYLVEDLGVQPIIDLVHYGAPLWLDGTFLAPDYPQRVAEYAGAVAERYGSLIRQWTPLNEPRVHAHFAGRAGIWPPYRRGERGFLAVFVALARGMARTMDAIRAAVPDAELVHVEALSVIEAARPALEPEVARRLEIPFLALDLVEGRVDAGHPLRPWLLDHGIPVHHLEELERPGRRMDIFGGNFYPQASCWVVEGEPDRPRSRRRQGTADDLAEALQVAAGRSDRPVMLTETSVGGSVRARGRWLEAVAGVVTDVRAAGVPLLGATWFPAFSLFSWDYRRGRRPPEAYLVHMGLWDLVDEGSGGLVPVATGLERRYAGLAQRVPAVAPAASIGAAAL